MINVASIAKTDMGIRRLFQGTDWPAESCLGFGPVFSFGKPSDFLTFWPDTDNSLWVELISDCGPHTGKES
jgi:hypothetical protein